MASSFSEGERVRLFTLSLPESFQFFSVGACSHWLVLLDGSTGDVFVSGLSWSPMSDMGQKRRLGIGRPLPVSHHKQTCSGSVTMSQTCHERTSLLFDHLVDTHQEGFRDHRRERLRGLAIDDQIELGRLFSTGRSPGFAPRRRLWTYSEARRNRSEMSGP